MKEREHVIAVLKDTRKALIQRDAFKLKELSNQTIHSATCFQDAGYTLTAVIVYSLSKIIDRQDYNKIKNWDELIRRFISFIDLSIKALQEDNIPAFESHLVRAKNALAGISGNLKPYIEEVLRKAAINKAGKLYEHGLSLGQTAKILGITQWELSSYAGEARNVLSGYNESLTTKKRAEMALEFFS